MPKVKTELELEPERQYAGVFRFKSTGVKEAPAVEKVYIKKYTFKGKEPPPKLILTLEW